MTARPFDEIMKSHICGNLNLHGRFSLKLGKSRNPNFPRVPGFSARANDK